MNFRITLYEAVYDSILFTDTLPNSAAPYFEQYYKCYCWIFGSFVNFRETLLRSVDELEKLEKFSVCRVEI